MTAESIAQIFLKHQPWFHLPCLAIIIGVRVFKERTFIGLLLHSVVLLTVAIGNAMVVELLTATNTLPLDTVIRLKASALISALVYGAIGANFIAFGATYDKPKEA